MTTKVKSPMIKEGDDIPVTAAGSTTARTLEDRFGDVVNVKDFGAEGKGGIDDSDAVQAALLAGWRVDGGDKIYRLDKQVGFRDNDFYTGKRQVIENCHFVLNYATHPVFTSHRSIGDEDSTADLYAGPVTFKNCSFTQSSPSVALNLDRLYNCYVEGCVIDGLKWFGVSEIPRGALPGGYSQSLYIHGNHVSRCGNDDPANGGFIKGELLINCNIGYNFFEYNLGRILDVTSSAQNLRVHNNNIEGGAQMMYLSNTVGSITDNYFENTNLTQAPVIDGVISEIYIKEDAPNVQQTNLDITSNRFHTESAYIDRTDFVPVRLHRVNMGKFWNVRFTNNSLTRSTTLDIGQRPLITSDHGQLAEYRANTVVRVDRLYDADLWANTAYHIERDSYSKSFRASVANKAVTEITINLKGSGKLTANLSVYTQAAAGLDTADCAVEVVGDFANITTLNEKSKTESPTIKFLTPSVANGILTLYVVSQQLYLYGDLTVNGVGSSDPTVTNRPDRGIVDEQDMTFITAATTSGARADAELNSASHSINTTGKALNTKVYNYDQSKYVYATGSSPTATWNDATDGNGNVVNTPV